MRFLTETDRKVRRALLKAVAAPGRQYNLKTESEVNSINSDKYSTQKYIQLFKEYLFFN